MDTHTREARIKRENEIKKRLLSRNADDVNEMKITKI